MKRMFKRAMYSLLLVPFFALVASLALPPMANAGTGCEPGDLTISSGAACAQGEEQPENLFGTGGIFQVITNILLFIIGAISVIMLIIGGIMYTVSAGDSGRMSTAKNTILYAIVGIVIAFLAYAAVNFVITQLVEQTN